MPTRVERIAPLITGVLMIVLSIAGAHQDGSHNPSAPSTTAPGGEVLSYLQHHHGAAGGGAFSLMLAAVAAVFFFGLVRRSLASSTKAEWLATVGFGGALVLATAWLVQAGVDFALDDVGTHLEAGTAQVLNVLQGDLSPMLVQAGVCLAMLGFGLAILRSGIFARWLGWATIAVGVLAVAGPLVSIATPLAAAWTVGMGFVLLTRSVDLTPRKTSSPAPTESATVA